MNSKHTPLPITASSDTLRIEEKPTAIMWQDERGVHVVNFDFMDVAVNNHDKLVEALREVIQVAEEGDFDVCGGLDRIIEARTLLAQLDEECDQ